MISDLFFWQFLLHNLQFRQPKAHFSSSVSAEGKAAVSIASY